jgi:5-formyltetrahydrofolate cyclo-ligase
MTFLASKDIFLSALKELKAKLRTEVYVRRKHAHAIASPEVLDHLVDWVMERKPAVVAGYLPIRTEIDPRPSMARLRELGCRVAVPEVIAAATPLRFLEWYPEVALKRGAFDVQIPEDTEELVPDLIIAPLVAFDRRCYRLGYGGGFYDRTLAGLGSLPVAGLAYKAQEIDEVPIEPTDMRLDALITETETLMPVPR